MGDGWSCGNTNMVGWCAGQLFFPELQLSLALLPRSFEKYYEKLTDDG